MTLTDRDGSKIKTQNDIKGLWNVTIYILYYDQKQATFDVAGPTLH